MTKRELIEALEALECDDDTPVESLHSFNLTDLRGADVLCELTKVVFEEVSDSIVLE